MQNGEAIDALSINGCNLANLLGYFLLYYGSEMDYISKFIVNAYGFSAILPPKHLSFIYN